MQLKESTENKEGTHSFLYIYNNSLCAITGVWLFVKNNSFQLHIVNKNNFTRALFMLLLILMNVVHNLASWILFIFQNYKIVIVNSQKDRKMDKMLIVSLMVVINIMIKMTVALVMVKMVTIMINLMTTAMVKISQAVNNVTMIK